jgi:hypothetical protein
MTAWLVRRCGLLDPATVGAAAAVMPDLEHLIPGPLRRNRKLFHPRRKREEPETNEVSVRVQLLLTALLILPVLAGKSAHGTATRPATQREPPALTS